MISSPSCSGCSFSFELPILQAGIRLRHIERDTDVPMYRTSIDCVPAGRFKGKMVVSMRAVHPGRRHPGGADHLALSVRARRAGASRPAGGDRHRATSTSPISAIRRDRATGELPVFWACGVTPQVAIEAAPPLHLHHAQAGLDADHRQEERHAGSALTVIPEFRASEICGTQGLPAMRSRRPWVPDISLARNSGMTVRALPARRSCR